MGGGVGVVLYSLANYSIAYEETQSNRVLDFRDFVCSLFPKALTFIILMFNSMVTNLPGAPGYKRDH